MTTPPPSGPDDPVSRPLFVYGTLRDPELRTFIPGERSDLTTQPAILTGYAKQQSPTLAYPFLVPEAGSQVEGELLLGLRAADYAILDAYEDVDQNLYERVAVTVETASGPASAWTYVKGPAAPPP